MTGHAERRRWRAGSPLLGLSLVGASVLVYAATLRSAFIGDDYEMLLHVSGGASPGRWLTELGPGGHLRPVAVATFWTSRHLGGLDPFGYHLVNAVLHGLVAWLVALVAAALLAGDGQERLRRTVPPFAALLFVVSPTHVEAVAWMVCRVDLLLTAFCLSSLLAWMRWRRTPGPKGWLALVPFALALGTKEAAITFPLVLVALELWLPDADGRAAGLRRCGLRLAAFGALVVAYLAWYLSMNGAFLSDEGTSIGSDGPLLIIRRGVQVLARTVAPGMSAPLWVVTILVVTVLLVIGVLGRGRAEVRADLRARAATFGFLLTAAVVLVAPVARLGASVLTPVGGRLAYLPSAFSTIGVALVGAIVVERAPRARRIGAGAVLAVATVALLVVNASYGRASQTSGRMIESAGAWPADSRVVSIVGLDSVEGLPVGRNALGAALELRNGWTNPLVYQDLGPPKLAEIFTTELAHGDAEVRVERGDCARCVRLRLDDDGSRFIPLVADGSARSVELPEGRATLVDDHTIELQLAPDVDPSTLWVLSRERMVPLSLPS